MIERILGSTGKGGMWSVSRKDGLLVIAIEQPTQFTESEATELAKSIMDVVLGKEDAE